MIVCLVSSRTSFNLFKPTYYRHTLVAERALAFAGSLTRGRDFVDELPRGVSASRFQKNCPSLKRWRVQVNLALGCQEVGKTTWPTMRPSWVTALAHFDWNRMPKALMLVLLVATRNRAVNRPTGPEWGWPMFERRWTASVVLWDRLKVLKATVGERCDERMVE